MNDVETAVHMNAIPGVQFSGPGLVELEQGAQHHLPAAIENGQHVEVGDVQAGAAEDDPRPGRALARRAVHSAARPRRSWAFIQSI